MFIYKFFFQSHCLKMCFPSKSKSVVALDRYELLKDPINMDFMSDEGFYHAIALARQVKPSEGLQTFATVCSTWVWISRASTQRSLGNPLGNVKSKGVAQANAMVTRMVLLICFLASRFIGWVLEQPASSLMARHPRMLMLQKMADTNPSLTGFYEVFTYMGAFGAETKKPTKLWSSEKWVRDLGRKLPADFARNTKLETVTVNTRGGVSGGRDLKNTQAYPDGYGVALRDLWAANRTEEVPTHDIDVHSEDSDEFSEDMWSDAEVSSLLEKKGVSAAHMPW